MKKVLALILAVCTALSVCSLAVAGEGGDNYGNDQNFDGKIHVLSVERTADSAAFTVTFSAPVHVSDNGYVWIRETNPTNGTNQIGTPTVSYVGADKTTVEGNDYSSVLSIKFTSIPTATQNYGLVFVEYFQNDTNEHALSPNKFVGLDGALVAGNYVNGEGLDFLWIPTDASDAAGNYDVHIKVSSTVSLVSAALDKDACEFSLKFSSPVHFFDNGYVWIREGNPENGSGQIGTPTVSYVGADKTTADGNDYSSEIKVKFTSVPDKTDVFGLVLVEYFTEDTNAGALSPAKFAGLDGALVKGNYVSGDGLDFLWIPTDAADTAGKYPVHITQNGSSEPGEDPDGFTVTGAEMNVATGVITFTFSKPVHIFNTGHIWLCTVPEPNGGYDQHGVGSVEYAGEIETDENGMKFSTAVKIGFGTSGFKFANDDTENVPYPELGVRFVEYNYKSDFNDGYVSKSVMRAIDGSLLKGNYKAAGSAGVDVCWVPCEDWASSIGARGLTSRWIGSRVYESVIKVDHADVIAAEVIDAAKGVVEFTFDRKVKIADAALVSSITLGEKVAQTCTPADGDGYSFTFSVGFGADVSGETGFSIPAGLFEDASGEILEKGVLSGSLADFAPAPVASATEGIESGAKYNFMNCDTGRSITVNGADEFTLTYDEALDKYFLTTDGGKYVNLMSLSVSDTPYAFDLFCDNDYERYQIVTNSGTIVLCDTDGGGTTVPTIGGYAFGNANIETGWYLTKSGDERPKKFTVVGDSITCGVIPNADSDGSGIKPGFRKELSQMLIAEYGRVVFVGSLKHAAGGNTTAVTTTTVYDDFLYRHEGHSGWVVHNQASYASGADDNNRGIDDDGVYTLNDGTTEEERHVRRVLQEKYAPDVIFMMIGINDVGKSGAYDGSDSKLAAIASRWETLVDNILEDLPEGGVLYAASLLPRTNSSGEWHVSQNAAISALNIKYKAIVDKKVAEGCESIRWADNFAYVHAAGPSTMSSDTIHPSIAGYTAIAESYFNAYKSDGANGNVRVESASINTTDGIVTITFTKPVHVFDKNSVWLCTVPTPNGGFDQHGYSSIDYVDAVTGEDGNKYAKTVKILYGASPFTFVKDGDPVPFDQLGIRIVEYNFSADQGNGTVSGGAVKALDGSLLEANYRSGNVDILWLPCENWASAMEERGLSSKYVDTRFYFYATVETEGAAKDGWDVNGDGSVSADDAIYLLYHVFFSEEYPISGNCDFNGDGSVTSEDAIYVLYHVFFPDSYPNLAGKA